MARCLIVGCGCRGQMLARALVQQGHSVRGTTREPDRAPAILACGAEAVVADPDRVGTLITALDHVSVTLILLGSAQGSRDQLAALHGPRLQMLLTRLIDTTVHGVIYEARGTVDPGLLEGGARLMEDFRQRSRAQIALLRADPEDPDGWAAQALAAVEAVLEQ